MGQHERGRGRNQARLHTGEDPYDRGHEEATAYYKAALGQALRHAMEAEPMPGQQQLDPGTARELFTAVFGVFEADRMFGPETLPMPLADLAGAQRRSARGAA